MSKEANQAIIKPGDTVRRYLKIAKYLEANPNASIDNPTPELTALGVRPISSFTTRYQTYAEMRLDESLDREKDEREARVITYTHKMGDSTQDITTKANADRTVTAMRNWNEAVGITIDADKDASEDDNINERLTSAAMKTGAQIYMHDQIRRFRAVASEEGRLQSIDETMSFLDYFSTAETSFPFANHTILSTFGKSLKNTSPVETLEFLTAPFVLLKAGVLDLALLDANNKYIAEYPAIGLTLAEDAIMSLAVGVTSDHAYSPQLRSQSKATRDATHLTFRYLKDMRERTGLIRETLQNHRAREHGEVVGLWADILEAGVDQVPFFFDATDHYEARKQIGTYRKLIACGFTNDDAVCQIAAEQFETEIRDNPQKHKTISLDAVKSFFDINGYDQTDGVVTSRNLKQETAGVKIPKDKDKVFSVDPKVVGSTGFVEPSKLAVDFDPKNTRIFTVDLTYPEQGEEGETAFQMQINTDKGTLDWNLLNDPMEDNPQVKQLREASLALATVAIKDVKDQIRVSAPTIAPVAPIVRPVKRERTQDLVYLLRKEARKGVPAEPEKAASSAQVESKEPVQIILIPEDDEWRRLTAGYSSENADAILRKLVEFNTTGVGDLKSITSAILREKYDYRLRANVKKDTARVLVQEAMTEPGVQYLAIANILKRADAYN